MLISGSVMFSTYSTVPSGAACSMQSEDTVVICHLWFVEGMSILSLLISLKNKLMWTHIVFISIQRNVKLGLGLWKALAGKKSR